MKYFYLTVFFVSSLFSQTYYYEFGKKVILNSSKQKRVTSDNNISYYTNENGIEVGVINDEIIVKCIDSKKCAEILSEYKLDDIEELTKTMFLVKLNSGENVFDIANKLHADSRIEFSKANTVRKTQKR